jgi:hypothetical protein
MNLTQTSRCDWAEHIDVTVTQAIAAVPSSAVAPRISAHADNTTATNGIGRKILPHSFSRKLDLPYKKLVQAASVGWVMMLKGVDFLGAI